MASPVMLLLLLAGVCASLANPASQPRTQSEYIPHVVSKDSQGNYVRWLDADGTASSGERCGLPGSGFLCRKFDGGRRMLSVDPVDGRCYKIRLAFESGVETSSVFELGDAHWYGGGEEIPQKWPLDKYTDLEHSMVTQEAKNRGIQDPVWYSSKGELIYVKPGAPLFLKLKSTAEGPCKGKLCLTFKDEAPYRARPGGVIVEVWHCYLGDAKEAFQMAVDKFLGKPTGHPDERMVKYPIWSTWAKFKADINDKVVREFAKEIKDNGFQNSQFEIDDAWETCYGSKVVDKKRFPNMKQLTTDLKADGFRVTIWTHPFVQIDCTETFNEGVSKDYLVKNEDGNTTTKWWNGVAGIVDFTNPDAANWFVTRHQKMMQENGIDGFKFDAGETSWNPQLPVFKGIVAGPEEDYPSKATSDYIRACATFNDLTEVRSAYHTQDLPIFLRMIDKDSRWGDDNGLQSLVTTLLQMNMVGYSMVLPDMIGGNQYNCEVATQELFLRWLQANTFMPSLQYALVPWDYDKDGKTETVTIAKKFNDLHADYTDIIMKAMKKNVADGSPVNPPIWWIDPSDENALKEGTEYLLGEHILVAPVLEKGAVTRDVYLPRGQWRDMNDKTKTYTGPTTITGYKAPLDTLPWFVIVGSDADKDYVTTTASPRTSTQSTSSTTPKSSSAGEHPLASTVVALLGLVCSLVLLR